jgi:ribonuclease D
MTNDKGSANKRTIEEQSQSSDRHLDFVISSDFDIPHSSFQSRVIATDARLAALLAKIDATNRVAIDTEADSLHSYREKLCLLQISVSVTAVDRIVDASLARRSPKAGRDGRSQLQVHDFIVDPLVDVDLAPLTTALEQKEIVLHGADYDLRLLRRDLNLNARRIFDTVLAARLLGIREFGLAALVKRYFGVELGKHSQKENWGRRPLPEKMQVYAINDVRYLLALADRLEAQLRECGRIDWLRQSCQRAIEQAAIDRIRDADELWRISGSAQLQGRPAAVLRALWQWREQEAKAADRPPFHILRNDELVNAAINFAAGKTPDHRHLFARRRRAFNEAAQSALESPESEWPILRRRFGKRPSPETVRRAEEMRHQRDRAARELDLEPSFIASRSTLLGIAADSSRATSLLVPWQWESLGL